MSKQNTYRLSTVVYALSVVLVVIALSILTLVRSLAPTAAAAANSYLNFQARLKTSAGGVVPDGNYNVEFKLYNASSSSGSSQGSCTGDSNCLWTETRTSGDRVRVANGYMTVSLGSVTAFGSSIDWGNQLWLTMNVGGTGGSPSWDGEMSPRLRLTAVPVAFRAYGVVSGNTATASTNSDVITIQSGNATGATSNSGSVTIDSGTATGTTGTISLAATNASSLILGRSGLTTLNNGSLTVTQNLTVDTSTLQVDSSNDAVGIRVAPGSSDTFVVSNGATTDNIIVLQDNTTAVLTIANGGAATFKNETDSTTAFLIQRASSGGTLLTVDTSTTSGERNGIISIGASDGDATLLVLDIKTDTGDPTGSEGAMYYNDDTNKFRCYQNTGWTDCIGAGGSTNLQSAYDNDADGSDATIALTSTDGSLILQNPSSGGSTSSYILTLNQLATGAVGGLDIQSSGTGNLLRVRDNTATAVDVLTIADGGAITARNQTNSTAAFAIQNAAGANIVRTDTTDSNLVLNPGAEVTFGSEWVAHGASVTVSRDTSNKWSGLASVSVVTPASTDRGVQNALGAALATNTVHYVSFYAKRDTTAFTDITVAYDRDGAGAGAEVTCSGYNTQTVVNTGWTRITCSFTSPVTAGDANAFLAIRQAAATARTFYIDGVQLETTAVTGYGAGALQVDALVTAPLFFQNAENSTTSLTVNQANGTTVLNVDTQNGYVGIGTAANLSAKLSVVNSADEEALLIRAYSGQTNANPLVLFQDSSGNENARLNADSASNISFGELAQVGVTSGSNNVAFGSSALYTNTTGAANVAIGQNALQFADGGNYNIGIGAAALSGTSGSNNIALGLQAGDSITSGNSNIVIGDGQDVASPTSSNQLNIAGLLTSDNYNTGNLVVGESDTTGQQLVLDTKTDSGDPTGVNGGIYYNSNAGKFRCYEGGTWKDCVSHFTDAGAETYLTSTTDDFVLGGSSASAGTLFMDVSAGALRVGNSSTAGSLVVSDGSSSTVTLKSATQAAATNYDLSVPAITANDTLCLLTLNNCSSNIMTSFDAYGVNQAASTTTALNIILPTTTTAFSVAVSGTTEFKVDRAGSFRSCAIMNSAAVTSGSVSVRFRKNGADTSATNYCTLNTTNTRTNGSTLSSGVETFSAGDTIGVALVSSSLAPTTSEHTVTFTIEYHNSGAGGVLSGDVINGGQNGQVIIGTNNSNSLLLETNNTTIATFTSTGQATFQNSTNSTTAFSIKNAANAALFNVDTTNNDLEVLSNNAATLRTWNTTSALTAARVSGGAVYGQNGYMYYLGGQNAGAQTTVYYSRVNADGTLDTWATTTALPNARTYFTPVVANGYIYVIGGNDSGGAATQTVYYALLNQDGTVGTWQTGSTNLTQVRANYAAATYNGYIYIIGGVNGGGTDQSTVYYAKPLGNGNITAWTTNATSLAPARNANSAVAANGYMYTVGGWEGSVGDSVDYAKINADGSVGTWIDNGGYGTAVENVTLFVANGYIYGVGGDGCSGGSPCATSYSAPLGSNGSVGTWTANTSLPANRGESGYAQANGYFYVMGGSTSNDGGGTISANVYYTSTSRIKVGGNLDLVSYSGENLAEGSTGGSLTAGDTTIVGRLSVMSSANFVREVNFNGGIAVVNGNLTVGTSDTTGALVILDTKTDSTDPTGVAGGMYYNSSLGRFRCYNTRWNDCFPTRATKSGDQTLTSSTNTNITDLSFSAAASTDYAFECSIIFNSDNTGTGIGLAFTTPTTPTYTSYMVQIPVSGDGLNSFFLGQGTSSDDTIVGTGVEATATNYTATIEGVIRNSTNAGTLQLRGRNEVGSGNVVLKQGSTCTFTQI